MRKKSAKQRKHLLLDILATINELSNTKKPGISDPFRVIITHHYHTSRILKKTLLIQYLAENFDKRLLYFTSVYLTSKKYIDFITLLPEPIVIKIISNIDPGIGLTSGQKYQFPANFRFRVFFSHADSDVKIHWNELEKFQKLGNSIHYRIKFGNKMLKKLTFHWSFILEVIVRPHQERSSQFSLVQIVTDF